MSNAQLVEFINSDACNNMGIRTGMTIGLQGFVESMSSEEFGGAICRLGDTVTYFCPYAIMEVSALMKGMKDIGSMPTLYLIPAVEFFSQINFNPVIGSSYRIDWRDLSDVDQIRVEIAGFSGSIVTREIEQH